MAGSTKEDPYSNEKTYPCKTCGRHFIKSSLSKHEPACKKLTKMQRKVFDSGKQRSQNSDIPYKAIKKAAQEREKNGGFFPRPKTHWRERHEEFIGAVSASKHVEIALKTGAPLPPPPKTSVPSDYVHCEFCGRNFNKTAAERHIPFCKEQNGRRGTSVNRARANSTGRIPTSKSLNAPSRSGSSRTTSRGQSPATRSATNASRQQPRTSSGKSPAPASRRSSVRQPTSAAIPPTANGGARASMNTASANAAHQRSGLPTPTKRSRSATRTATSRSGSTAKSPRALTAKPRTAKPKTPGVPKTPNVPKTPSTSNGKAPKTPKPKTPSSKPKTPKRPKSRSPAKTSFLSTLASLTGFALGAPQNNQPKGRDKSPTPIKNGQPKSQRVRTSGSVKRR